MTGDGSSASNKGWRVFARGFVDPRRRPLIQIKTIAGATLTCLVDTGCESEILMDSATAVDFGVKQSKLFGYGPKQADEPSIVTATGQRAVVSIAFLEIEWDGEARTANVSVLQTGSMSAHTHDPYAPSALLGCALMQDKRLVIDFASKTLTIASSKAK
jgi:predicted aspartyl protease